MLKSNTLSLKIQTKNSRLRIFELLLVLCALCSVLCTLLYAQEHAQEQFVYDSKGKRNPFIPLVAPDGRLLKFDENEKESGNLALEGIIYDKSGQSYAIVNAQIVRIGDEVGGYQVLKIEKNKVIFVKDGQPKEVELKEEE